MASGMYGSIHKYFLQCMMSRSIVSKRTALKLLKQISDMLGDSTYRRVTNEQLSETLKDINQKISSFGMELKEIISELSSEEFVVFINVVDNSSLMEKIGHIYTVKERDVFRLLLEGIVMNETYGTITLIQAVNLIPNMRPSEVESIIARLISDQWFIETENGLLVPAPRCIAEFDLYFKKNFEDYIQSCSCANVVFYGIMCSHCNSIIHKHCFLKYNKRKDRQERKCPICKADIVDETETGDNAEDGRNETPQQRKRGPKQARYDKMQGTPQNTPAPARFENSTPHEEIASSRPLRNSKRHSSE